MSSHIQGKHPRSRPKHNPSRRALSVREKIFQAQHDTAGIGGPVAGPELDLFFHELKDHARSGRRAFDLPAATAGLVLLVLLYPLIALIVKASHKGSVIARIPTVGKSGRLFDRYEFRTVSAIRENSDARAEVVSLSDGSSLLYKTGLYRLPGVINILKNDINLVGPQMYGRQQSREWNARLDQFYKRFAVKPGLIPVAAVNHGEATQAVVERQLQKEFRYLVAPTLKNDWKVLRGQF